MCVVCLTILNGFIVYFGGFVVYFDGFIVLFWWFHIFFGGVHTTSSRFCWFYSDWLWVKADQTGTLGDGGWPSRATIVWSFAKAYAGCSLPG